MGPTNVPQTPGSGSKDPPKTPKGPPATDTPLPAESSKPISVSKPSIDNDICPIYAEKLKKSGRHMSTSSSSDSGCATKASGRATPPCPKLTLADKPHHPFQMSLSGSGLCPGVTKVVRNQVKCPKDSVAEPCDFKYEPPIIPPRDPNIVALLLPKKPLLPCAPKSPHIKVPTFGFGWKAFGKFKELIPITMLMGCVLTGAFSYSLYALITKPDVHVWRGHRPEAPPYEKVKFYQARKLYVVNPDQYKLNKEQANLRREIGFYKT